MLPLRFVKCIKTVGKFQMYSELDGRRLNIKQIKNYFYYKIYFAIIVYYYV